MYYLSPRVFRYSVLFYEKTSLFTHNTDIHTHIHEFYMNGVEEKKREEKRKKDGSNAA